MIPSTFRFEEAYGIVTLVGYRIPGYNDSYFCAFMIVGVVRMKRSGLVWDPRSEQRQTISKQVEDILNIQFHGRHDDQIMDFTFQRDQALT